MRRSGARRAAEQEEKSGPETVAFGSFCRFFPLLRHALRAAARILAHRFFPLPGSLVALRASSTQYGTYLVFLPPESGAFGAAPNNVFTKLRTSGAPRGTGFGTLTSKYYYVTCLFPIDSWAESHILQTPSAPAGQPIVVPYYPFTLLREG